MTLELTDFSTLTFDCYGTLIDWESGIWDALQPLLLANRVGHVDRRLGLETFATIESAQERDTPDMLYPTLLTYVHGKIAAELGLKSSPALDQAFGASVPHWPAFPDSADALRLLKRRFRLVILSNVNRDGFAASARKLGVEFDAIHTAEDVGCYKPDHGNFRYLLAHLKRDLGVEPEQVLHTAQSLHHDHVPASAFGLAKAWIDRQGLENTENWGATARVSERPEVDFRYPDMMSMALAAVQATSNA